MLLLLNKVCIYVYVDCIARNLNSNILIHGALLVVRDSLRPQSVKWASVSPFIQCPVQQWTWALWHGSSSAGPRCAGRAWKGTQVMHPGWSSKSEEGNGPLLSDPWETTSAVLLTRYTGMSSGKATEVVRGAGAPGIRREAETVQNAQPEKWETQGRSCCHH